MARTHINLELLEKNGMYPKELDVKEKHRIITLSYLSNQYSYLPLDFLARQAKKFSFQLLSTVVDLEGNINVDSDGMVHFKKKQRFLQLPFPRDKQRPTVPIDDELEQELRSVEEFFKTFTHFSRALSAGKSMERCPSCGVSFFPEDFLHCNEGCEVCATCISLHLCSMAQCKKTASFGCISQNRCWGKGIYEEDSMRRFFKDNTEVLAVLDEVIKLQAERVRKLKMQEWKEKSAKNGIKELDGGETSKMRAIPNLCMISYLHELSPVDQDYKLVADYYKSTQGGGEIRAILSVHTSVRHKPHGVANRCLLWHGTPEGNVAAILKGGLKCNCDCGGLCFFASTARMSNGYAQKNGLQEQYYMLAAEVNNPKCHRVKVASKKVKRLDNGLCIPSANAEWTVDRNDRIFIRYLLVYGFA